MRAMASSTAFSCLSSSSRRDSVLLGLEPGPAPPPTKAEGGTLGLLPGGTAVVPLGPFPDEDLGGGDKGRFLSPWGATALGPWPRGRSSRGEGGGRPGILLSRPLSGDIAILLLRGDPGLSLSEGRYLFLLPLSPCLVRRVSLMSLWDPEPPWLPGGPMVVGGGCRELVALFPGPDLGIGCPPLADGPVGSNLLRSSLKASSFFDGLSRCLSLPCGGRSRGGPRSLRG